jgi:Right handed beta helix region
VVARDAAGNSSTQASLTASTSACSAPPPPPPPPAVADKFAAPNGSDSNPGTLAAPYQSVAKLMSSLSAGQTGMLRGGTYGDASTYTPINVSGGSGQPITLTNYPGETPTVKGYVEVNGDYITIRGLRIDGSNSVMVNPGKCGTQALGLLLQGHDEIFEHNEVFQSGNKGSAIIQHGDRNIIRYNKLHDFGTCYAYDHGVYVGDGDSVQIYGNWIWNNPHGWGIQVYPGPTNARIHDNVIDSNGGGFVISDDGTATSTGNQIYENVVMNSVGMTTQSGYYISGAGISGAGPVAGSNNSFTTNDAFNTPIGSVSNIAMSGNMTTDPAFVDAGGHNYAVSSSSPLAGWGLWDGK